MTSIYSHDIILVLFHWIIKQDYKKNIKSLEAGASLIMLQNTQIINSYKRVGFSTIV